ncbi:MAG: DM9 repeat-containing protein [Rhodospirillaceae bacterium]
MTFHLFALALGLVLASTSALAQGLGTMPGDEMVPPLGQQVSAADVPGLAWVPTAPNTLPPDAMPTGVDAGRTVYVCRVRNDGVRIGKLVVDTCLVPMSGAEIGFPEYEVLTGDPWLIRWIPGSGLQPSSGLVAGQVAGQPALLCLVEHMGGVHPGMVIHDRCHFGLNGKEIMAVDYRYAEPNPPGAFSMRFASGGWVPPGALSVAEDAAQPSAPVLCLAQSGAEWVPGMLDGSGACVHVTDRQSIERAASYTVVVGDPSRVAWVTYEGGELPRWEGPPEFSVRIGGYRPNGPPREVCRADLGGQLVAGHVEGGQCLVVAGGTQVAALPRYQVLHYIGETQQAAGPEGLR